MKILAKVTLPDAKTTQEIIRVWGNNFNPENSIILQGNQAIICFNFDESPREMTEILSKCEIDEFIYGSNNTAGVESIDSDTKKEKVKSVKKEPGEIKKTVEVPILDEIAKQSNSFDDFITKVGNWLAMQTLQSTFEKIVHVSCTMEQISWSEIEKALRKDGITINIYIRQKISGKINAKLSKYFSRTLSFLKALKSYKDYQFEAKKEDEEVTQAATALTVKMDCMPYIELFDKALCDSKMIEPIEDKVKCIINVMTISSEYTAIQIEKITSIVKAAMELDNFDWDSIFDSIRIPVEERDESRMMLSKFINDYLKNYGFGENIKTMDFLRDLKKVLMGEESKSEE